MTALELQGKVKRLKEFAELAYAQARAKERDALAEPDPAKRLALLSRSNHHYRLGRQFVKERQQLLKQ